MATLAGLAAQAGVSQATVSRVLNSKPGVSESTRAAVLTALDVLGYERPAPLRQRSAGLVGLVVPELSNPIFPAFAQEIENALTRRRFTPVLCAQAPGGISEDEYVETLLDHGVAGILFVSGRHADSHADMTRYAKLTTRGLPIVLVNGYVDGIAAPFVSVDDGEAVALAVRHLVDLGHRRIGLVVGPSRFVPAARKRAGFLEVTGSLLGWSAEEAETWIEEGYYTVAGGSAATTALLDKGATAVVAASDLMAMGAVRAARSAGLGVPSDVSVIGFDDSMFLPFFDPPLTTVRQPVHDMAVAAVTALIDAIDGRPVKNREYVYSPDLVLRHSTGPAPR